MQRLRLRRAVAVAVGGTALGFATGGTAGCGEEEDPALRQSVREATITAEVRSRIIASEGLGPLPVTVNTRAGAVHVTGSVHDSSQAGLIRAIAANVRGVRDVRMDVSVVPPPDTTAAAPPPPSRRESPAPAPPESLPSLEEAG